MGGHDLSVGSVANWFALSVEKMPCRVRLSHLDEAGTNRIASAYKLLYYRGDSGFDLLGSSA